MEKLLTQKTQHDSHITEISIDNTTESKDFSAIKTDLDGKSIGKLFISKDDTTLRIGSITLIGREIELLKEFLAQ